MKNATKSQPVWIFLDAVDELLGDEEKVLLELQPI